MEKSKEYSVRFYRNGRCFCKVSFDNAEDAEAFTVEDLGIEKRVYGPVIDLPGEEWRDVLGYEGKYMVSDMGRVKSMNYMRWGVERLLSPSYEERGYARCILNGRKDVSVHRLVYEAFNGKIQEGLWINHINRNPSDNRLCNLEVVTPRENSQHWVSDLNGGVGAFPYRGGWRCEINHMGRKIYLGQYASRDDAESVYWTIAPELDRIRMVGK